MQLEPSSQSSSPYFHVALHLCHPVSNQSVVGRVCGSRAELQLLAVSDDCERNKRRRDTLQQVSRQYCWNIPRDTQLPKWLNNDSDPSQGGWIVFGSLNCCPWNGTQPSYPGTPGSLHLRVKLEPPDVSEYCENTDYVELSGLSSNDFQVVFKCSLSQSEYFDIVVKTSRLCPRNIDYELNVNLTKLNCDTHQMNNSLVCRITPRRTDGNVTSDFVCSLHHFQVEAIGSLGATTYYLTELATVSDKCVFSLPSKGLDAVIVTYLFGLSGDIRNISESPYRLDKSPSNDKWWIIGGAVGGFVVCVIVVIIIISTSCFVYRRKCCDSHGVGEFGDQCASLGGCNTGHTPAAAAANITPVNDVISQEGDQTDLDAGQSQALLGQDNILQTGVPDGNGEHEQLLFEADPVHDQLDWKEGSVDGPDPHNINSATQCCSDKGNHASDSGRPTDRLVENINDFPTDDSDLRKQFADSPGTLSSSSACQSLDNQRHHTIIILNDGQSWMTTAAADMQVAVKGQLVAKPSICVIRRGCDQDFVCKDICPLAEAYGLHVFDIHDQNQELGVHFIDFIWKCIDLSSYFVIICSPEPDVGENDCWFKYTIDLALHETITDANSWHKLLIVSTDGEEKTVQKSLRVFTYLHWNLEEDKQRLAEMFQLIG